jgi:hypothetical protein
VRTSPGRSGAGLGNTNAAVLFTNRPAAACVLLGYPTVAGISAGGAVTPLAASHGSYFGDPGPTANIAPGQTAAVNVSGADACQAARRASTSTTGGCGSSGRVQAAALAEVPRPAAANSGAAKPLKNQPGQPHRPGREQHVR